MSPVSYPLAATIVDEEKNAARQELKGMKAKEDHQGPEAGHQGASQTSTAVNHGDIPQRGTTAEKASLACERVHPSLNSSTATVMGGSFRVRGSKTHKEVANGVLNEILLPIAWRGGTSSRILDQMPSRSRGNTNHQEGCGTMDGQDDLDLASQCFSYLSEDSQHTMLRNRAIQMVTEMLTTRTDEILIGDHQRVVQTARRALFRRITSIFNGQTEEFWDPFDNIHFDIGRRVKVSAATASSPAENMIGQVSQGQGQAPHEDENEAQRGTEKDRSSKSMKKVKKASSSTQQDELHRRDADAAKLNEGGTSQGRAQG
ncbi:unnamed protein product, partial [Amoebophrya sp. A25]